jgi:molybdopterin molybdotransferase
MVSIEEALKLVGEQQVNLDIIELPLEGSLHYHLAENIFAPFDLPSFDNSAMDGYALCGSGLSFDIVDEVAAGDTRILELSEGQAMRIFTGSKVPQKTTAVVMQEKIRVVGNQLVLSEEEQSGKNIRKKGGEVAEGQLVLEPGHLISPATMGMISSLGINRVVVFRKPTIRIIATGNELIKVGESRTEGKIYESNSLSLLGALQDHGFSCESRLILRDDLSTITKGIAENLKNCEVLLISGGISVGDYDFAKEALEANGVSEIFYKVLQRPGKPLYFGRKGNSFVFALPGNPASALTCFYIYALPLLQKIAGGKGLGLKRLRLPLSHPYVMKFGRPTYLKATIESYAVSILEHQGSSMISSMAVGNALVLIEKPEEYQKGDLVECILI